MALFGSRSDEAPDAPTMPSPLATPAPVSARSQLSAFIDQGSEFEGKLTFKDTVRIDGSFRGEISSENTLVVGETGEIFATVRSRQVVIAGVVHGDVFAKEKLVLQKTARVEGDVHAGSLQMEDGARLNGRITMDGATATRAGGKSEAPKGDGAASPRPMPKPGS
jgi:cytoskeletal protein CcmA (bactofilin family)